uniref:Ciliary rootlet coiled-coil, rootletin family member 2 n=1 Tax=Neogobius melanostomus TaxID=47308 RepID=A0A8C6TTP2_9GOBI
MLHSVDSLHLQQQHRDGERQHLVEGLSRQLQEAEDEVVKLRAELIEAHRGLQECVHERDVQHKEVLDLKRILGDETREKETIQETNEALRILIKKAESENSRRSAEEREQKMSILEEYRSSTQHEAATLRSTLREQEKSRLEARRALQELRRQIKTLDGENKQQKQELTELYGRICQEEQKEEEARREVFSLKQRVLESDAGRDAALGEVGATREGQKEPSLFQVTGLQRRVAELETAEHQNQKLLQQLESSQLQREQRHRETTAQLEGALDDAMIQIRHLTMQGDLSDSKTQGLEKQLDLGKARRRDLETQLVGLHSALRRTVLTSHTPATNASHRRSPSPWRKHTQFKSRSMGVLVHCFHNYVAIMICDEALTQIDNLRCRVTELQDNLKTSTSQIELLQKSLKESEDEMGERLHKALTSLTLQEEASHRAEREKRGLQDELAHLKNTLRSADLELSQSSGSRASAEQQRLKEALEAAENEVTRLDLSHRALEGEAQRAQLRAAELEAEAATLQHRLTELRRRLGESDDQCAALRLSEERLNTQLSRAETQETQLKEQVLKMSLSLKDSRGGTGALEEQIIQLQRALTASEQDRRTLQEHLDKTREALSESKKLNHSLTERTQSSQRSQEDTELKYSELEKLNNSLKEVSLKQQDADLDSQRRLQQLRHERKDLQENVKTLQDALQKVQRERAEMERAVSRLGKDKSALRKSLGKVRGSIKTIKQTTLKGIAIHLNEAKKELKVV